MTDNYTESLFRWASESYSLNMIVDENGIIRYIGRQHAAMYNGTPADFEGRLVTDVIPNTGVLRVLATGEAEHGELFVVAEGKEHEDVYAISRIPIRDHDGILRGVFTMALFSSLDTVDRLRKEVVNLRKANALYSKQLRGLTKHDFVLEDVAGISPSIMAVKGVVARAAPSDLPVLLTGETGVGKEVFADAIHRLSNRKDYNFVKINCAAIPKDLIESELFGYEPGAFSGALRTGKKGKLEQANRGTVLLDEIGELPMPMQSKLLRVLQEYEFERIGGTRVIHLDVRVIAATNQDLHRLVKEGKFRSDLYYRLNVIEVEIPALRERPEDLAPLCTVLLQKIEARYQMEPHSISSSAMALLRSYSWPGNVRELEHCLARACVMSDRTVLTEHEFSFLRAFDCGPAPIAPPEELPAPPREPPQQAAGGGLKSAKAAAEREEIAHALWQVRGNKVKAAQLLGISRSRLYVKMKEYGIDPWSI